MLKATSTQFVVNNRKDRSPLDMNSNAVRAVIWDMDGVIVDTGPYHCQSWQYVFKKQGINFTEEDFQHIFGQRNDTIIRKTIGRNLTQTEVDAIAKDKEEFFRRSRETEPESVSGCNQFASNP